MYRSSSDTLLDCQRRNAARKEACSAARRDAAAQFTVDSRIALFNTLRTPEQLAEQFGPNLGHDALMLQNQSESARAAILTGTSDTVADTPRQSPRAPKVVSLNAQPSQVNGCEWTLPPQETVGRDPIPTMPLRAPVEVTTPIGLATFPPPISPDMPAWTNLCWALRNGAVDASQFDPTELQTLQYRCNQLGYTGACPPPPDTLQYLNVGRFNHTLPHIQVSADLLTSLNPAPTDIGGCPDSYRRAGLTGYAPTWADALSVREDVTAEGSGPLSWFAEHPWLTLAAIAGGAAVLSRRSRR